MKTKLYLQLFLLFCLCTLSSCLAEVEDYFDTPASARMEKEIVKYRELLPSPKYGWAMEYYPGGANQMYGGFALAVTFSPKGQATFQSSLSDDVSKSSQSLYSLKKDMGATLNFDTFNSIFHNFSDPDLAEGQGKGKGFLGDYEFILYSCSESEILMRGKKHGSAIRMYALQQPAQEYLEKAKKNRVGYVDMPGVSGLEGTFAGKPVKGTVISAQYFMLTQEENTTKFSFMFTDKGCKLYAPIVLGDQKVEELIWKVDEKVFVSPDGNTRLSLILSPGAHLAKDFLGEWKLSYSDGTRGPNKQVDVKIILENGLFLMKGLPFDIVLIYDNVKGVMSINPQMLSQGIFLASHDTSSELLHFDLKTPGQTTRWEEKGDDIVLEFVPERFEGNNWTHFVIWDVKKRDVYEGYGLFLLTNMKLTKKR